MKEGQNATVEAAAKFIAKWAPSGQGREMTEDLIDLMKTTTEAYHFDLFSVAGKG